MPAATFEHLSALSVAKGAGSRSRSAHQVTSRPVWSRRASPRSVPSCPAATWAADRGRGCRGRGNSRPSMGSSFSASPARCRAIHRPT